MTIDGNGYSVTLTTSGARLVDVTSTSTAIYNNVTVQNITSNGAVYVNGDTADFFVIKNSHFGNLSIYSADDTQVLNNVFTNFLLWGTRATVTGNTVSGVGQRIVDVMGDGALGSPSFSGCPARGDNVFTGNTFINTDPSLSTEATALAIRCSTNNTFTNNIFQGTNGTSAVLLKDAAESNLFENNQLLADRAPAGALYFSDSSTYVSDPALNIFQQNTIIGTTAPAITQLYTSGGNRFENNLLVSGAGDIASLRVDPTAGRIAPDVYDHNTFYQTSLTGNGLLIGTSTVTQNQFPTHWEFTNNIVNFAGTKVYDVVGPINWTGIVANHNDYFDRSGSLVMGSYDFNNDGTPETIPSLAGWQSSTATDNNSIVTDPLFVNATSNDFRLQSTSLAVGAGTNSTNIGAKETYIPPCTPNWQCTAWLQCTVSGTQSRTCTDTNACGVTTGKPAESQSCTPPDTTLPIVNVTSPTTGSTLWGNVTLIANATDNVGVVGVQFKINGVNQGTEVTTAPYQVSWMANVAGNYSITAVARDAAGNTKVSTPIAVTVKAPCTPNWQCTAWLQCIVSGTQSRTCTDANACGVTTGKPSESQTCTPPDTTVPSVNVTAPTAGATVWGTISLTATATDNIGVAGVQFRINGINQGVEDITAPYQVSWTANIAGNYSITAVARDAAGNTKVSAAIAVVAVAPCTPNWQCTTWSLCSTSGTQSRTCTDTNACGVTTGKPGESQSCTPPDITVPSVNVTAPFAGATVWGTITLAATATDNVGVVGVQFKVNGVNQGAEDTTAPYQVSWTANVAGNYSITAVARDAAGNTKVSAPITVAAVAPCTPNWQCTAWLQCIVSGTQSRTCTDSNACGVTTGKPTVQQSCTPPDTTLPTAIVTVPTAGAMVWGTVTLSATATDNVGVVGVQFKVNGINQGMEVLVAPYQITWNVSVAGNYSITVVTRDAAGNTKTSDPILVTAVAPCTPNWQCTTWAQCTVSGTQSRTCTDTNACGVTTGKPAEVQSCIIAPVDSIPPSVSSVRPIGGHTVSGIITLSARVTDKVGVAHVDFYVGNTLLVSDTKTGYATSWDTRKTTNGPTTFTIKAYDKAGNVTSVKTTVTIKNKLDYTVTSSITKGVVSGTASLTVNQYGGDPITRVQFSQNAISGFSDRQAPYVYVWDTTKLRNGYRWLYITAFDKNGNYTQKSIQYRVKN